MTTMSSENLKPDKLAVLIDADNTTATCAQDLLEEIADDSMRMQAGTASQS